MLRAVPSDSRTLRWSILLVLAAFLGGIQLLLDFLVSCSYHLSIDIVVESDPLGSGRLSVGVM